MERLQESCARLIWLESAVALERFRAKIAGRYGRCCRTSTSSAPVHNLDSLRALIATLSAPARAGAMDRWRNAA
jgi:uncharacterized protein with von Willebrand factor type A (vWA) domain